MSGISLSGLASGLDTNAMIEQLMKLERQPYEALETKKSAIADKQSVIRSINTKMSSLRTAASELMYSTAFKLTSGKVSDSTVLTAKTSESAEVGTYAVNVTQLAKHHIVASGKFATNGTELKGLTGPDFTFSVAGKSVDNIKLSGNTNEEVLNNLMKDINNAGIGIKASVIETEPGFKTLSLTSEQSGESAIIEFSNSESSNPLQLNTVQGAKNSIVTINGLQIINTSNTLNNIVQGIKFELHKENETSTLTVSKDADLVADKVKKFVDAYNDIIDTIRTNTNKGALMQGDSTLRSLQDELSNMLHANVSENSKYNYLFTIGLEVDKGITSGALMTGKISFDRDKFKEAFNDNADEVAKLFGYDDASSNKDGIGTLFNDNISKWTRFGTGLLSFKINGYDSELSIIAEQMERMSMRISNKEQQLLKQFAAMENALSSFKSEQTWLTAQLASFSNY